MDEGMDIDFSNDISDVTDDSSDSIEALDMDALQTDFEPLEDTTFDESFLAEDLNDTETPISEQEMREFYNEVEALEIQPLDDGIDLGYNYDEAIEAANEEWEAEEQAYKPSTFENMINSGAEGITSPSEWAQIASGVIAPPNAEDAFSQLLQGGTNAALAGAEGLMEAAHNQHDIRPRVPLEGVDFVYGENGEMNPISQMINGIDENGESIWVRPEN